MQTWTVSLLLPSMQVMTVSLLMLSDGILAWILGAFSHGGNNSRRATSMTALFLEEAQGHRQLEGIQLTHHFIGGQNSHPVSAADFTIR